MYRANQTPSTPIRSSLDPPPCIRVVVVSRPRCSARFRRTGTGPRSRYRAESHTPLVRSVEHARGSRSDLAGRCDILPRCPCCVVTALLRCCYSSVRLHLLSGTCRPSAGGWSLDSIYRYGTQVVPREQRSSSPSIGFPLVLHLSPWFARLERTAKQLLLRPRTFPTI